MDESISVAVDLVTTGPMARPCQGNQIRKREVSRTRGKRRKIMSR
jgi:hypothetical protein